MDGGVEGESHHFLSMEYIHGEDPASLLRRIGKFPHDKAVDIARDLCAGLAAAHAAHTGLRARTSSGLRSWPTPFGLGDG